MSITTVEQLEALPEGAEIVVTSRALGEQRWQKADGLFLRDGAAVRPVTFVGAIDAGQVREPEVEVVPAVDPAPEDLTGRLWGGAASGWVVHTCDGDTLHTVNLSGGFFGLESHPRGFFGNPAPWVDPTPEWVPVVARLGRQLYEAQRNLTETAPMGGINVGHLHAFINERSWYDDDDRDALDQWLVDQGHGRVLLHSVEVRMWGTVPMSLDVGDARDILGLPEGVSVESVPTVAVEWERVVTIELSGPGCQCGEVNSTHLSDFIPSGGTLSDYETNCA